MAITRRHLTLSALLFGTAAAAAPSVALAKASAKEPAAKGAPVSDPTARPTFSKADGDTTTVAGIAGARFAADDEAAFLAALGTAATLSQEPWLALSGGGSNGAFGAGLVSGWSAAGRPNFAVVSGLSTGALTAPFVFAGPAYDEALRAAFTTVSAADIFEFGATRESLLDTWPLARLIEKQVTAKLLADVAAQHRLGRRLIVVTTNVDSGRPVGWNMGAIAAAGGPAAAKLFRDVLLASSSIPGLFPPTYIEVESNGRRFAEMHVDGCVTAPFYVAPESLIAGGTGRSLPARQVYVVVNNQLAPDFAVTPKLTLGVLGRSMAAAVKAGTRLSIGVHQGFARRAGIDLRVATIGERFTQAESGPFDPVYMKALFAYGAEASRDGTAFGPGGPRVTTASN